MKKHTIWLAALAMLTATAGLQAGDNDAKDEAVLSRGYLLDVKFGHEEQFAKAMKQQVDWYRHQKDDWAWHVWQYETGPNVGNFTFRSPGHTWEDMDARADRARRARENFMKVVTPHLEGMHGTISAVMTEMSHWPEDMAEVKMVSIYDFDVHYGMGEEFTDTIGIIHEAIMAAEWPVNYAWGATVSGGNVPSFWLVVPHANYASMKGPDTPFWEMMEDQLGPSKANDVRERMRKCVKNETSALARFRPDLSYIPAGDGD